MPRYEVIAYIYVEADDPAKARDVAVLGLEYMQDNFYDGDGAIVDCFVDIEPDCLEP